MGSTLARPLILIANDDGVASPGLRVLFEVARDIGKAVVVAPDRERSTTGHSLTLHKPLRLRQVEENWYSTSGSPADCIYLGLHQVCKTAPNLILSGINRGANLGTDIHYSGTVAAAREGAVLGVQSAAFSLAAPPRPHPLGKARSRGKPKKVSVRQWNFEGCQAALHRILKWLCTQPYRENTYFNFNFPAGLELNSKARILLTKQGKRTYENSISRRVDPRGRAYYWIGGPPLVSRARRDAPVWDTDAVESGNISVTPLQLDCTSGELYNRLNGHLGPLQ